MIMNKKKVSGIGNVLDGALIIFVLFILFCSYVNVSKNRISNMWVDETPSSITLTVMFPDIENENDILPGDELYLKENDDYFGKVDNVSPIYKSTYKVYKNAAVAKRSFTDDVIGLSITIDVPLKKTARGSFINESIFIAPGSEFELYKRGSDTFNADVNYIVFRDTK